MKNMLKGTFVAGALLVMPLSANAFAAQPLVDTAWLKPNLGKENLVVLDIRSRLGGGSQEVFNAGHIPGSVYSDYLKDGWRVKNADGTPGVLPSKEQLAALFGKLGISNNSHVVIIPAGKRALDMGSATRVYWTFKVAGHDKISILDGGFNAWVSEKGNAIATGPSQVTSANFTVNFRPELLATKDDVKAAIGTNTSLVDNRPNNQFLGVNKHPASKRWGTIPGSKNVPENWLTKNGGGLFREPAKLKKLYSTAKVSGQGEEINFCNTGHWASLGWFVSHELLGNKKARLYDGSMVEWTADQSAPTEAAVDVN